MKHLCQSILSVAPHIKQALHNHLPVVALQSTIISHGMPYPQNKQCALSIQSKVKQHGAIPATVAVIDGKIKVGLTQQQIQRLAFQGPKSVKKVSRRDLPEIIMSKGLGATTVSSTMIAADMTGIQVFVTGGIGGVHRGYDHTLDASADLRQLGQTPVTVVSAGIKSILDIPKTLEYLETQGVPVITYNSEWFPAFFSASSGIKSPSFLKSTLEIAKVLFQKQKLGLKNGALIAVPNNNPAEGQMIQKAIQQALKQADKQKISGAKITPFLLKMVSELTQGQSLKSNISLVHNNAQIGSKIAVDLSRLQEQSRKKYPLFSFSSFSSFQHKQNNCSKSCSNESKAEHKQGKKCCSKSQNHCQSDQTIYLNKGDQGCSGKGKNQPKVIIIGASAIDSAYRPLKGEKFQLYKSCRGYSTRLMGGVGRNIAQVCARLQIPTTLITPLSNDSSSSRIRAHTQSLGINLCSLDTSAYNTAQYLTIMDHENDEMIGISQMQINNQLTFDNIYNSYFSQQNTLNPTKDIVIIDANVNNCETNVEDLKKLLGYLNQKGYFVIYECKGKKTMKVADPQVLKLVSLLRMNQVQFEQLFKVLGQRGTTVQASKQQQYLSSLISSRRTVQHSLESLTFSTRSLITNKCQPIKLLHSNGNKTLKQVKKCQTVAKSTGAGDTLTGTLVSMLLKGKNINEALNYCLIASRLSLQTTNKESVISDQISVTKLQQILKSEL